MPGVAEVDAEPLLSVLAVPLDGLVEVEPFSDELFDMLEGEAPLLVELVLCVALVEDVLLLFLFLCRSPMARA